METSQRSRSRVNNRTKRPSNSSPEMTLYWIEPKLVTITTRIRALKMMVMGTQIELSPSKTQAAGPKTQRVCPLWTALGVSLFVTWALAETKRLKALWMLEDLIFSQASITSSAPIRRILTLFKSRRRLSQSKNRRRQLKMTIATTLRRKKPRVRSRMKVIHTLKIMNSKRKWRSEWTDPILI